MFLNTKPVFMRVFYWIHQIRKDELTTDRFIAVELDRGFFIGTYKYHLHRMWRRLAEDSFENKETELIEKLIPNFNYFIDIGAHIGYYTCLVHHLAPHIPIISFEPNPENFISLQKNIEMNKISNCKSYQIGLGDKKEKVILYGIDAMGSIVKETYDLKTLPKEQITVEIDKLDTFIKDIPIGSKVFIKVDVEGNELNMLHGGLEFIKKIKPIGFIMEICLKWSVQENPHYQETLDTLDRLGYRVTPIGEGVGSFLFLQKNSQILL